MANATSTGAWFSAAVPLHEFWCTFFNLVLWIAVRILKVSYLLAYMDDSFSVTASRISLRYRPYQCSMPADQVILLRLWDELNISHKPSKQISGPVLEIIGFEVNPAQMTFSLADKRRSELVAAIADFLASPDRRRSLREWHHIDG